MLDKLLRALGGLGLFLFGMSVMTQGPRGLAGNLHEVALAVLLRKVLRAKHRGGSATGRRAALIASQRLENLRCAHHILE